MCSRDRVVWHADADKAVPENVRIVRVGEQAVLGKRTLLGAGAAPSDAVVWA